MPLTTRCGDHGRLDLQTRSSSSTNSSRCNAGHGMAGVRVAGAMMFALVLTGLAGIFSSIEENVSMPRPAASMTALDQDETRTAAAAVGSDDISGNTHKFPS